MGPRGMGAAVSAARGLVLEYLAPDCYVEQDETSPAVLLFSCVITTIKLCAYTLSRASGGRQHREGGGRPGGPRGGVSD